MKTTEKSYFPGFSIKNFFLFFSLNSIPIYIFPSLTINDNIKFNVKARVYKRIRAMVEVSVLGLAFCIRFRILLRI